MAEKIPPILQTALKDFNATATVSPNLTDAELLQKFPEFNNDTKLLQAAKDYVVTAKSGKYPTEGELNSKFPEFDESNYQVKTPEAKKQNANVLGLKAWDGMNIIGTPTDIFANGVAPELKSSSPQQKNTLASQIITAKPTGVIPVIAQFAGYKWNDGQPATQVQPTDVNSSIYTDAPEGLKQVQPFTKLQESLTEKMNLGDLNAKINESYKEGTIAYGKGWGEDNGIMPIYPDEAKKYFPNGTENITKEQAINAINSKKEEKEKQVQQEGSSFDQYLDKNFSGDVDAINQSYGGQQLKNITDGVIALSGNIKGLTKGENVAENATGAVLNSINTIFSILPVVQVIGFSQTVGQLAENGIEAAILNDKSILTEDKGVLKDIVNNAMTLPSQFLEGFGLNSPAFKNLGGILNTVSQIGLIYGGAKLMEQVKANGSGVPYTKANLVEISNKFDALNKLTLKAIKKEALTKQDIHDASNSINDMLKDSETLKSIVNINPNISPEDKQNFNDNLDRRNQEKELASQIIKDPEPQPTVLPEGEKLTPTIISRDRRYYGNNHGEAMDNAIEKGEQGIPDKNTPYGKQFREQNGLFEDAQGNLFYRNELEQKYGIRRSAEIPEANRVEIPMHDYPPTVEGTINNLIDDTQKKIEGQGNETGVKSEGKPSTKQPLTAAQLDLVKDLESGKRVFVYGEMEETPTELKTPQDIVDAEFHGNIESLTEDEVKERYGNEKIPVFSEVNKEFDEHKRANKREEPLEKVFSEPPQEEVKPEEKTVEMTEGMSHNDYIRKVAEESENPNEIAQAYKMEQEANTGTAQLNEESEVSQFMVDITSGRIDTKHGSPMSKILAKRYKEVTGNNISTYEKPVPKKAEVVPQQTEPSTFGSTPEEQAEYEDYYNYGKGKEALTGVPENGTETTQAGQVSESGTPQPPETENTPTSEEDNMTTSLKRSVADNEKTQREGVSAVENMVSQLQDTDVKSAYENAKVKVDSGEIKAEDVTDRVIKEKKGTLEDEATMLYDRARMRNQEIRILSDMAKSTDDVSKDALKSEYDKLMEKQFKNDEAAAILGREASNIFRLRQEFTDSEFSLFSMEREYRAARNLGGELTPEQLKDIQAKYKGLKDSEVRLKDLEDKLQKEISEKESLQKQVDNFNKSIKERGKYSPKQREKIPEIQQELSKRALDIIARNVEYLSAKAGFIKMAEGLDKPEVAKDIRELAGIVSELVKNEIILGAETLADAIKKVKDKFQDKLDDKFITDSFSGKYDEKTPKTKSEIQQRLKSLQTEAKLRTEYDDVLKGKDVKSKKVSDTDSEDVKDVKNKINDEINRRKEEAAREQSKTSETALTEEAKKDIAKPILEARTSDDIYNQAQLKNKQRQIEELKNNIEQFKNGTYKPKELKTRTISPELEKARIDHAALQLKWKAEQYAEMMKNRSKLEKFVAKSLQTRIALNLLSGVKTLGKLLNFTAIEVAVKEPLDLLITGLVNATPGLRKLSQGSLTEGHYTPSDFLKFYKDLTSKETFKSVAKYAKSTHSDLDLLWGDIKTIVPDEFKVSGGFLHGLEKEPIRRATWEKYYRIAERQMQKNTPGLDVENRGVQKLIGGLALEKANTRIMRNTNAFTKLLSVTQRYMYNQGGLWKAPYYLSKALFPIVRVPTNFAIKTARAWGGLFEATYRISKGIDQMTPEAKDKAMYAFKEGLPGLALATLAITTNFVSWDEKKHTLNIGGMDMPNWLTHHPLIATAKVYAMAKNEFNKKDGGLASAVEQIPLQTLKEVPFFSDQLTGVIKDSKQLNIFMENFLLSFIQPQLIKDIAGWTYNKKGDPSVKGFEAKLKSGYPYFINDLPTKLQVEKDKLEAPIKHKTEEEKEEAKNKKITTREKLNADLEKEGKSPVQPKPKESKSSSKGKFKSPVYNPYKKKKKWNQ